MNDILDQMKNTDPKKLTEVVQLYLHYIKIFKTIETISQSRKGNLLVKSDLYTERLS